MSIQSEITRIQNQRDASFTAIAEKGVTVPAGSTMDDLPGLIALIDTLTFDSTPTTGSTNPVTSEGIKSYVDGRDPFMLLDFNTGTLSGFTVTSCTTATMPTGLSTGRVDIEVPLKLRADWAIASLAKWEGFNANGTRVPIFPVFSFSMNGQIILRTGWKAAGTNSISVAKISGAVLLKHR